MDGDSRLGTEIAGYRIESVLGQGGMSVVYLAEQHVPRRKVALKLMAPDLAQDGKFRDRFLRESNSAAAIDHPNIIPIYGAGEQDGVLYIAMRYVRGTDLRKVLEAEGALSPERTVAILQQVANGLDAAHAEGLIHRDVKPGNILMTPGQGSKPEHVYLADFGLTKRTSSDSGLTGTGQFIGTLDYAAPEQIQGTQTDARTDVYSLGCVAYECLTGAVPFARDAEMAVMWAHVHQPPPNPTELRPKLPPAVDEVVTKAMAKAPEERYASCGVFAEALRRAIEPSHAPGATGDGAPSPPSPTAAPRRSRRTAAVAILGAVLVAAVAIGFSLVGRHPARPGPTGGPSASPAPAGSLEGLVWFDASTRHVSKVLRPGTAFGQFKAIAIGEGGVWVTGGISPLVHVDPKTHTVRATVLDVSEGLDVAVGDQAVWVGNGVNAQAGPLPLTLTKVDPATDSILDTIQVGTGGGSVVGVATGPGAVWALDEQQSRLIRIDALTDKVTGTFPVGTDPVAVTVGEGAVWVADFGTTSVLKIDPATGGIEATIPLSGTLTRLAVGLGGVWVTSDSQGTVTLIDPKKDLVTKVIPTGAGANGVTVGGGYVWVANRDAGTVSQVDPVLQEVINVVTTGGFPGGIAFDPATGTVWVGVSPGHPGERPGGG